MTAEVSNAARTVQAYFDAAAKQDAPALLKTLHEEARIEVPVSLPYGGTYIGANGFQQALSGFGAAWDNSETTGLTLVAGNNVVVALSRMTATARATGRPVDTGIAEVFHFRDDKILLVQPFYQDTAALVHALTA